MLDRKGRIPKNLNLKSSSYSCGVRGDTFLCFSWTGAWRDQQRAHSWGDTVWSSGGGVLLQRNAAERCEQEILLAGK